MPEQKACTRCPKYPTFGEVPYNFCMISGVYYVIDMSDITCPHPILGSADVVVDLT